MPATSKLEQIMARTEGFGLPGAIPTIRRNPLDIRHGPNCQHPGGPAHANDIGTEPTVDAGWADGARQLAIYGSGTVADNLATGVYPDCACKWSLAINDLPVVEHAPHLLNLMELTYLWAPVRDGNNTAAYLQSMVTGLGLPANTALSAALKIPPA